MFVAKKKLLFSARRMKLHFVKSVTVESIVPISLPANTPVSLFFILPPKIPLPVTFAGREWHYFFVKKIELYLCRECDIPIHKANEYTKNHSRFLLTGIKLSAAAASYQASTSFSTTGSNNANEIFGTHSNVNTSETTSTTLSRVHNNGPDQSASQEGSVSTSSISEYLIETLPGWHVEDLLDPSSPGVFCKIDDQIISPSTNDDEVESNFGTISSKDIPYAVTPNINSLS
ncbi:B-box zinc finger protein 20-like [Forsythia ovata]|uniref:B-box zinc finger protein 20-like n=1 Tax=Forsythia ovata TaxID=205694 RepID=A0ABD1QLL7_9LAMI